MPHEDLRLKAHAALDRDIAARLRYERAELDALLAHCAVGATAERKAAAHDEQRAAHRALSRAQDEVIVLVRDIAIAERDEHLEGEPPLEQHEPPPAVVSGNVVARVGGVDLHVRCPHPLSLKVSAERATPEGVRVFNVEVCGAPAAPGATS